MTDIWILYQITNNLNGKIYVGVHKLANNYTSKNYLGSGLAIKKAIKKYGRENFTRNTLAEFSCGEDAYKAEEATVTKEFISREDTYNMKIGGIGCRGLVHTPESRAKMSATHQERNKNLTEEDKARIKAARRSRVYSKKPETKMLAAKLSVKRHEKLMKYAESQDKDMTSAIECWIDSLPEVQVVN